MVFCLRQLINQSQIAKGHKSMPRYSNLKLKPNLQADVVMFKGKENVLSQEQKALNNLNMLEKCLKTNQKIEFGGREQAKKVIKQHVIASAFGGGFIKNPIGSAGALVLNEAVMAVRIGKEYGFNSLSAKTITSLASGSSGAMISKELVPKTTELNKSIHSALADLIQKSVSDVFGASIAQVVPLVGRVVNAGVATATTFTFGEACMTMFESWVKNKPKDGLGCVSFFNNKKTDNITDQEARKLEKKYNELLDKGILPRKIGESACHIKHSSYWNSKEYYDDVKDWNELYDSGQIGHGWTPSPPPMYYTSNGASCVPEGENVKDDSRVDQYGNRESYYKSESYHRYVDDWNELYDSGQIGHGFTPPPPPNYGPY